jgi:hypothetical protein
MYGEDHSLIMKTATDELDLPLDGLSLRWDDAVHAVEQYSGMPVSHLRQGAFGKRLAE